MKRFVYYVVWVMIIGLFITQVADFVNVMRENISTSYTWWPFVITSILFYMIMGVLFKLPGSLLNRNRERWGCDWVKLLAVGVPSLYVALTPLLIRSPFGNWLPFIDQVLTPVVPIPGIAGIVCGYIILDSLRVSGEKSLF